MIKPSLLYSLFSGFVIIAAAEAKPAAATKLKVAPGFKVETVYEVPLTEQGSWVALTLDDKGRLLESDQGAKGHFRITLPGGAVEKMPVELSGAQGLAWQAGALNKRNADRKK